MATHSSTLAWKIPWVEEPGRLQSMGSWRVGHDWVTPLSLFTFLYWRRKWQPTPVFLPRESQGRGNLEGYHLWGRTELDTTEVTQQQQQPYWFDCCSFLYSLKSKTVMPPALFFFLKITLAIQSLFWFHKDFRIVCSNSTLSHPSL